MRIRLLNDGGFTGLGDVKFPIEVNGNVEDDGDICVLGRELRNIDGVDPHHFAAAWPYYWSSDSWEAI